MTKRVVLRDVVDELGSRRLQVETRADGALLVRGEDAGDGVEQAFGEGIREYEWIWSIDAEQVTVVQAALGGGDDVLAELAARFSGPDAAGLGDWLDSIGVVVNKWSRVGG